MKLLTLGVLVTLVLRRQLREARYLALAAGGSLLLNTVALGSCRPQNCQKTHPMLTAPAPWDGGAKPIPWGTTSNCFSRR
jgi:hypothetical protein